MPPLHEAHQALVALADAAAASLQKVLMLKTYTHEIPLGILEVNTD